MSHNLVGLRFGRLTAFYKCGSRNGNVLWMCRCDCGKTKNCKWATPKEQCKPGTRRPRTCPHCGGILNYRFLHKLKRLMAA